MPVGEHIIELVVDDGMDESEPDYCTITVMTPMELLLDLYYYIDELNLHKETANSLKAKLNTAIKLFEDSNENNDEAAVNVLQAFISSVEAQRGKKIPEPYADELIISAQEIIELFSEK